MNTRKSNWHQHAKPPPRAPAQTALVVGSLSPRKSVLVQVLVSVLYMPLFWIEFVPISVGSVSFCQHDGPPIFAVSTPRHVPIVFVVSLSIGSSRPPFQSWAGSRDRCETIVGLEHGTNKVFVSACTSITFITKPSQYNCIGSVSVYPLFT